MEHLGSGCDYPDGQRPHSYLYSAFKHHHLREIVVAKDAQTLEYKCHIDTHLNSVVSRVPVSDLTYIGVRSGLIALRA